MPKPLWIAVEAGIGDSAKVWRFAQVLLTPAEAPRSPTRREVAAAIGFLVQLWLKVADKRETGDLSDVPDGLLASWAGWDGDPETFVGHFRTTFLNDGQINDWEDHQGRLIEYRAKERARWLQRKQARPSASTPPVPPVEPPPVLHPPDGYGHSKNSTPAASPRCEVCSPLESDLLDRMVAPEDRTAVIAFLDRAPASTGNREAWIARLLAYLQGLDFPAGVLPSPAQLATACRDYAGGFAPVHVRAFVLRAVQGLSPPKNGSHPKRDTTQDQVDAGRRWAARGG